MRHFHLSNIKFYRSTVKTSSLCLITILFSLSYTNAFSKTITVTCPTVQTSLTSKFKVSSPDGYQWSSWQSQPNLHVSTKEDENYFAEINQSSKGLTLRCTGHSGNNWYGFYTNNLKVDSCKIDPNSKTSFICETND